MRLTVRALSREVEAQGKRIKALEAELREHRRFLPDWYRYHRSEEES